jgi:glycosyltransferase involved in cell wall biosynthesis
MKEADGFVVLTQKAHEILFGGASSRPVEVIPCCVDIGRFTGLRMDDRSATRRELRVEQRRVLVYVGSFGGWYLTDEMIEFFAAARDFDANTFVMVLTQRDVEKAAEKMRLAGFSDDDFLVKSIPPDALPQYLNAADAGVSFIKRCYSKQASSPTKNAEYLAAGLPIVANTGIGDVDKLISEKGVGVLIDKMDRDAYAEAMRGLDELGDVGDRCRETARREFDLVTVGGARYLRLYHALLNDGGE